MKNNKKFGRIALIVALLVVVSVASIAGTVAWLQDKTGTVTNTFSPSTINIDLSETGATKDQTTGNATWSQKMIPGNEIDKDPKVTVEKGSEASWVFVKIEKSVSLDTFIDYDVIDEDSEKGDSTYKWTKLNTDNAENYEVYYCEVADLSAATADVVIPVIGYKKNDSTFEQNKVLVRNVSKAQMDGLKVESAIQPTLTFTAYAIQKANFATAQAAWEAITP